MVLMFTILIFLLVVFAHLIPPLMVPVFVFVVLATLKLMGNASRLRVQQGNMKRVARVSLTNASQTKHVLMVFVFLNLHVQ